MGDETKKRWTAAERADYVWPPCPKCGGATTGKWINAGTGLRSQDYWIPGKYSCAASCTRSRGG